MMRYLHSLLWPILAQSSVFACSLDIYDHTVSASSDEVVIRLTGGSSAPESYRAPIVTREGNRIEIGFESPAPGTNCFASPLPWSHAVVVGDLGAGSHDVVVTRDSIEIHVFAFDWPVVHDPSMPGAGFSPSEGMWWSSDNPGTGLAFNIDNQGRWFAALYLYDEAGEPTFVTLQGESLAYNIDHESDEPYAVGTSPVIRSEDGQCMGCPWTQATTSDTGLDAQLMFHSRNRATLTIGDWSLDLTLLPETPASASVKAAPMLDRYYALTVSSESGQHVAVVKGIPGDGAVFTGQSRYALECVDCRTVDAEGNSSDMTDKDLIEFVNDEINFLCNPGNSCSVSIGDVAGLPYIDKTGTVITAAVTDQDDPESTTTQIELRLLPEGWR